MRLAINTNLHPISRRFFTLLRVIGRQGVPLFNTLVWGEPPKLRTMKFNLKKLETSSHRVVQSAFRYLESFMCMCRSRV